MEVTSQTLDRPDGSDPPALPPFVVQRPDVARHYKEGFQKASAGGDDRPRLSRIHPILQVADSELPAFRAYLPGTLREPAHPGHVAGPDHLPRERVDDKGVGELERSVRRGLWDVLGRG